MLGLPTEGEIGDRRRIAHYVLEAPSVGMDATIADIVDLGVRDQPTAVVSSEGVLVGAVQATALGLPPTTPVERVMILAPGTVRPDMRVDEVLEQLRNDGLDHVYVTTASGVLVGLIVAGDVHA